MKSCEKEVMRNSSANFNPDNFKFDSCLVLNGMAKVTRRNKVDKFVIINSVFQHSRYIKSIKSISHCSFNNQKKLFPEKEILERRKKMIEKLEREKHTRNKTNATYI